jgi:hypothetical protein
LNGAGLAHALGLTDLGTGSGVFDLLSAPVQSGLGAPELNPMPGRTKDFSKPTRIVTSHALKSAWLSSRDAGGKPGRPGIDQVTAETFRRQVDKQIELIVAQIKTGKYRFSGLTPIFLV